MSWNRIIERLYIKGKLTKEQVSLAQTKGLINTQQKELICKTQEPETNEEA